MERRSFLKGIVALLGASIAKAGSFLPNFKPKPKEQPKVYAWVGRLRVKTLLNRPEPCGLLQGDFVTWNEFGFTADIMETGRGSDLVKVGCNKVPPLHLLGDGCTIGTGLWKG